MEEENGAVIDDNDVDIDIALSIANLWDALGKATEDERLIEILERHRLFKVDLEEYLAEIFKD